MAVDGGRSKPLCACTLYDYQNAISAKYPIQPPIVVVVCVVSRINGILPLTNNSCLCRSEAINSPRINWPHLNQCNLSIHAQTHSHSPARNEFPSLRLCCCNRYKLFLFRFGEREKYNFRKIFPNCLAQAIIVWCNRLSASARQRRLFRFQLLFYSIRLSETRNERRKKLSFKWQTANERESFISILEMFPLLSAAIVFVLGAFCTRKSFEMRTIPCLFLSFRLWSDDKLSWIQMIVTITASSTSSKCAKKRRKRRTKAPTNWSNRPRHNYIVSMRGTALWKSIKFYVAIARDAICNNEKLLFELLFPWKLWVLSFVRFAPTGFGNKLNKMIAIQTREPLDADGINGKKRKRKRKLHLLFVCVCHPVTNEPATPTLNYFKTNAVDTIW